jgi:hypothetical protein
MCSVLISEQTPIISLYSIDWLISVIERGCVYCTVQTASLIKIRTNFYLKILMLMLTLLPKIEESSGKKYIFSILDRKLQKNAFTQLALCNLKLYLCNLKIFMQLKTIFMQLKTIFMYFKNIYAT